MTIQQRFGIKLRSFRLQAKLSQEKLALRAELDRTYIPGIEKGERNISLAVIEKLALALEVPIKEFFEE